MRLRSPRPPRRQPVDVDGAPADATHRVRRPRRPRRTHAEAADATRRCDRRRRPDAVLESIRPATPANRRRSRAGGPARRKPKLGSKPPRPRTSRQPRRPRRPSRTSGGSRHRPSRRPRPSARQPPFRQRRRPSVVAGCRGCSGCSCSLCWAVSGTSPGSCSAPRPTRSRRSSDCPQDEALALVDDFEWEITVDQDRSDEYRTPGQVILTSPSAGEDLAEGSPLLLVVSEGPEFRQVPDLSGLTLGRRRGRDRAARARRRRADDRLQRGRPGGHRHLVERRRAFPSAARCSQVPRSSWSCPTGRSHGVCRSCAA